MKVLEKEDLLLGGFELCVNDNPLCPYCLHYIDINWTGDDFGDDFEIECPNCEKEFGVTVEFTPTFNTRKIDVK